MFNVTDVKVLKSGNVACMIDGLACVTKYLSIRDGLEDLISLQDVRSIAYELYHDFYHPHYEGRNLDAKQSRILQNKLIVSIVAAFLGEQL
jgi:hypothetical protein